MPRIPLTVIQKQPGNITPAGNPLVLLSTHQFKDNNGNILYDPWLTRLGPTSQPNIILTE